MVRLVRTLFLMGHDNDRESAMVDQFLEALAGTSAGGQNRERATAEAVDDRRGIQSAAAGGIFGGLDVGPVFERKTIHRDRPVNGRIYREGNNQSTMLARRGSGFNGGRAGHWLPVADRGSRADSRR